MAAIEFPIGGIDDGVVRLRLHADADLEPVAAASLDPEVQRWTRVPADNSAGAMREWIDDWRSGPGEELAERCGFRFEGVLRSWLVIKGRPRDAAMYSLLRDEVPDGD